MQNLFLKIGNIFMKPLLRSPLHFLASGRVMLITFTGRKSGKVYTTPVEYRRVENTVIFSTQRNRVWWKNLQDNAGVTLRIKGRKVEGMVEQLVFDEKEAAKEFKVIYPRLSDERAAKFAANALIVKVGVGG